LPSRSDASITFFRRLVVAIVDELKYQFEKVLFPTDFSKYSQKILECINELPGVRDVVLLHVNYSGLKTGAFSSPERTALILGSPSEPPGRST